jgi:3-phenylpropionate/trans-cinnamate dioxygenase ferredoxin subunit
MGCELSYGLLNGENVTCACHGSVFNVKTGSVVRGPAKKPTPTFEVKVEGDQILVNT